MPNARNLLYHKNNFTALIIQAAVYICTLLEFKVCVKFKKLNLKISQLLFYYFLWLCSPAQDMASSFHEISCSQTTTRHSR
jgi:hypothetical protein